MVQSPGPQVVLSELGLNPASHLQPAAISRGPEGPTLQGAAQTPISHSVLRAGGGGRGREWVGSRSRGMRWRGGEQVEGKEGAQGGNPRLHSPPPGRLLGWRTPSSGGGADGLLHSWK